MPDYKSMYSNLFNAITKAIDIMQKAQQETDDLYMSADEPTIKFIPPNEDDSDERRSSK